MTLEIPPAVIVQAAIAFLACIVAVLLGLLVAHQAWGHHDQRAEREFLVGFTILAIGILWGVSGLAITLGTMFRSDGAQAEVQALVVFSNAAVRILLVVIGIHLLVDHWRDRRRA